MYHLSLTIGPHMNIVFAPHIVVTIVTRFIHQSFGLFPLQHSEIHVTSQWTFFLSNCLRNSYNVPLSWYCDTSALVLSAQPSDRNIDCYWCDSPSGNNSKCRHFDFDHDLPVSGIDCSNAEYYVRTCKCKCACTHSLPDSLWTVCMN